MAAAEVLHDSFSGSLSADVFGNDLGDVDIWGENPQGQSFDPRSNAQEGAMMKSMEQPKFTAAPPLPPTIMSPQKPPRTPSGAGLRKTLVVKPPPSQQQQHLRRSFSSESQKTASSSDASSTKPVSRTKLRRLSASNPRLVSPAPPAPEDDYSPPKPMSVAEKRRQRHEALSSRATGLDASQTESDETFPKLGNQSFEIESNHTGTTAPFDASCSSFSISGLSHDMDHHSCDLKDMSQSHSSVGSSFGSSFRRRKSHHTVEASPSKPEQKGHSIDDLQKHIETVLTECPDVAPIRSPRERRGDVPPPPRPTSSPRTPRRSRKSLTEQRSPAVREGSVPRAGGKIKFVRDSEETGEEDEKSRRSSGSTRTKATSASKISYSSKPSRTSSLAVASPRPKKGPSENKPPRSRSSPSVKAIRTGSQMIQPRSSMETQPSPARRRPSECEGSRTRSSSGTPRRKIKYVKKVEIARSDSIAKLEF